MTVNIYSYSKVQGHASNPKGSSQTLTYIDINIRYVLVKSFGHDRLSFGGVLYFWVKGFDSVI